MMIEEKEIARFEARYADDSPTSVVVYQSFAVVRLYGDILGEPQGLMSFETAEGECLNRIGRGHYRTLAGFDLRTDSPDAP